MLIRHGKPLLNDEFTYRDIRIEGDRIAEIMPYDASVPREGEEVLDVFGSVITCCSKCHSECYQFFF